MRVAIGQFHTLDREILAFASQLGVSSIQMNTPIIPGTKRWEYEDVRTLVDTCNEYGLALEAIENVPRAFYDKVMFGLPGRDEQLENYCHTIRNVGRAGVRILGHHFTPNYVWRTSFTTPGRGGAHVSSFDLATVEATHKVMIYKVDEKVGSHTPIAHTLSDPYVDEALMWANYEYFLRAVLPTAEESGVKLALHPADPPLAGVGGATRLFRSVESFKNAAEIANSDAWGLNLCLGCCSEMPGGSKNVFEMIEHFGALGKIVYVHFRDVRGSLPPFQECFLGEGNYDPAEVLLALRRVGFAGFLLDDHVPKVINDSNWGHRSRGYTVGYIQGLLRMLSTVEPLKH